MIVLNCTPLAEAEELAIMDMQISVHFHGAILIRHDSIVSTLLG